MHATMGQFNIAQGGNRGFPAVQCDIQSGDQKAVFDGIKPLRALRMSHSHFMFPAIGMGKVSGHSHSMGLPLNYFQVR